MALTLEDFPKPPEADKPLSQVPVQFLIHVQKSKRSCEQSLQFVAPTPIDRSCTAVPSGTTFKTTVAVTAKPGARSVPNTNYQFSCHDNDVIARLICMLAAAVSL